MGDVFPTWKEDIIITSTFYYYDVLLVEIVTSN